VTNWGVINDLRHRYFPSFAFKSIVHFVQMRLHTIFRKNNAK